MKTLILFLLISINAQAKNSFQISLFGITHHGTHIPPSEPLQMKNKLSQDAVWAYNPQFNLTRYKENGDLLNASFVVDCYRNAALNLAIGKRYNYNDRLKYGYVYGLYFRTRPGDIKEVPFKFGENYQLFPTAAGILQYKVTEKITLRLTANYVINFFDIAFEF